MERTVLLTQGYEIEHENILLPEESKGPDPAFVPGMTVFEAEKMLILKTLEFTGQNRTRAAELLGISIRTLRNKLNEYKESSL